MLDNGDAKSKKKKKSKKGDRKCRGPTLEKIVGEDLNEKVTFE